MVAAGEPSGRATHSSSSATCTTGGGSERLLVGVHLQPVAVGEHLGRLEHVVGLEVDDHEPTVLDPDASMMPYTPDGRPSASGTWPRRTSRGAPCRARRRRPVERTPGWPAPNAPAGRRTGGTARAPPRPGTDARPGRRGRGEGRAGRPPAARRAPPGRRGCRSARSGRAAPRRPGRAWHARWTSVRRWRARSVRRSDT